MSEIIFSSKLMPSVEQQTHRKYFAIPVTFIKAILTFSEKPEINHFERVVLSLLSKKYYTTAELSEMLLLKQDLIDFILNKLSKKGYIDSNNNVTEKGKEILLNVYKDFRTQNCYLFFDHNRGCLLSGYCNSNDIIFSYGRNNNTEYSFTLDKDAFKIESTYKLIKNDHKEKRITEDLINAIVRRDVFRKNNESNLVNVNIIEINTRMYHFISYIETSSDYKGTKWTIKNPITLENDEGLYDYFYNNNNPSVKKLILGVMNYRLNSQDDKEISKIYELIKNDLFNKKINPLHEEFILPLISVLKVLKDSKNIDYAVRVHRNETIKSAMVNLGDLYEKVLYQAAMSSSKRSEYEYLCKTVKDNQDRLKEFALAAGFDVSENGQKLLTITKKSLKQIISNPSRAQLGECISWNLLLTTLDQDFYMSKLAKKHPNFINLMYQFKREYRDENKHTTSVSEVSPKLFIDILFDILDLAFGYKVNKNVLDKIINFNETVCDYSYAEEILRTKLGNELFASSSKTMNELKFNLLSMYDSYITENCKYLTYAYPILEESIKKIVLAVQSKYQCEYKNINELFASKEELNQFLLDKGFDMQASDNIGNNVIDSLDYVGVEKNIEGGFNTQFSASVLRVKLLALIEMMKQIDSISQEFVEKGLKDLFVITSSISYLQGHQQVHIFNNKHASTIVNGIIKIIDFIINKSELIKWN